MSREVISAGIPFSELCEISWQSLKGKRCLCFGASLFVGLMHSGGAMIPYLGDFAGYLLAPFFAGNILLLLRVIRGEEPSFDAIYVPCNRYFRFVWASIRMHIFIFLWGLLLIIPGIIAACRYAMTTFIMLDYPECSVKEAMTESSEIMYGHKLQFMGYTSLLILICVAGSICTLGIGLFWLLPWAYTFYAAFYDSIRRQC